MKSSVLALIAVAAIGISGAAFAGQATKPAAMSDAQMDAVTAGDPGNGNGFAGGGFGQDRADYVRLSNGQGADRNGPSGGNSDFGHNH
jgi:hypothetical protein